MAKNKVKKQDWEIVDVKPSKIEGKGLFTKKSLKKGDVIGLAHVDGEPTETIGNYHNHSDNPNAESILIGNNRYLIASKNLKPNQEITVDYRKQPELEQPEDFEGSSVTEYPMMGGGGKIKKYPQGGSTKTPFQEYLDKYPNRPNTDTLYHIPIVHQHPPYTDTENLRIADLEKAREDSYKTMTPEQRMERYKSDVSKYPYIQQWIDQQKYGSENPIEMNFLPANYPVQQFPNGGRALEQPIDNVEIKKPNFLYNKSQFPTQAEITDWLIKNNRIRENDKVTYYSDTTGTNSSDYNYDEDILYFNWSTPNAGGAKMGFRKIPEINPIPFSPGSYYSRPRQNQEQGSNQFGRVGLVDYFDKNTGKLLGTYENGGELPEAGSGYKVIRSNERKGKTHKVIGPDGTVKFFGDSKLGQHPKDPARKKAFYARHKKNLAKNPYFRAFARKTWADGGELNDWEILDTAQDGKTINIQDNRTVDQWGNLMKNSQRKNIKNVDKNLVEELIKGSVKRNIDPATTLAMALQETQLGTYDTEYLKTGTNPLHRNEVDDLGFNRNINRDLDFLKQKYNTARSLGKTSDADSIQSWNGYGKLKLEPLAWKNTNMSGDHERMYGIKSETLPIKTENDSYFGKLERPYIDMNKNPVYGKTIVNLRDSVIKQNPEIVDLINKYQPNQNKPISPKKPYIEPRIFPGQSVPTMEFGKGGMLPDLMEMAFGGRLPMAGDGKKVLSNEEKRKILSTKGILPEQEFQRNALQEKLANNLYPVGYNTSNFINALFEKNKGRQTLEDILKLHYADSSKELAGSRLDAYNFYMGKPQKYNTFDISDYRPSKEKDPNATYYKLNYFQNRYAPDSSVTDLEDLFKYKSLAEHDFPFLFSNKEKSKVHAADAYVMANYTLSKGEDEKGKYYSYYDKWDISPMDFGKPFEIYDRIYYDPETNKIIPPKKPYIQKAPLPGQSVPTMDFAQGGQFLTVGGEYHRIYKNADGDIMVNHPKEDKGKWDTINLTDKAGAKTVADGVAATKKWHRENPYAFGGNVILERYGDGGSIWEILPEAQEGKITLDEFRPKFANSNAAIQQRLKAKAVMDQRAREIDPRTLPVENKQSIVQANPQGVASKAWEIVGHPMTAITNLNKYGRIPDYFSAGSTNPLEYAFDVVNPAFYANAAGRTLKNIVNPQTYTDVPMAAASLVGNMVLPGNQIPQEWDEALVRTAGRAGDAVSTLPVVGASAFAGAKGFREIAKRSPAVRELVYKGINPTGYGAREKITSFIPNVIKYSMNPDAKLSDIEKDFIKRGGMSESDINYANTYAKNRLDAWRLGLNLDQKYNTFEKIGEDTYRIDPNKIFFNEADAAHIYGDVQAAKILGENKNNPSYKQTLQERIALKNLSNDIFKKLPESFDYNMYPYWKQRRIVDNANKNFDASVYDADRYAGVAGGFRWDVKTDPENFLHFQLNDTWDLHPFAARGQISTKQIGNKASKALREKSNYKMLEDIEMLNLAGGKPFKIQNNFIVDPKNYQIIKAYKKGGTVSNWEIVDDNEWEII